MKNRNGKLPYRKTSFFRIAKMRLMYKAPMAISVLAQGLVSIKAIAATNKPLTLKKLAIVKELLNTRSSYIKLINYDL